MIIKLKKNSGFQNKIKLSTVLTSVADPNPHPYRILMFLSLPDPLVKSTDPAPDPAPDPDPSITKQKL
jgi:hypothetical protein